MKKRASLLIVLTYAMAAYAQTAPSWIPFKWQSQNINNRQIEKTSFTVPVRIDGIPHQFDAQFDLGAASTIVYGNTITPYLDKYGKLKQNIDTTRSVQIQGEVCPVITGVDITLGNAVFQKRDVVLFNGFGELMTHDSVDTHTIKHIGTVAADLFNNGILVIDYQNQRLCGLESLPATWENEFQFVDIDYIPEQNWILIPININGNVRKVLFDTGSSMFPLLSSPTNIAQIADMEHCADSLSVGAWGNEVKVYGYNPVQKIALDNTVFEYMPVYASEYLSDDVLQEAGFWGIVGNRYFLNKTIVIDYVNKRFGISLR